MTIQTGNVHNANGEVLTYCYKCRRYVPPDKVAWTRKGKSSCKGCESRRINGGTAFRIGAKGK